MASLLPVIESLSLCLFSSTTIDTDELNFNPPPRPRPRFSDHYILNHELLRLSFPHIYIFITLFLSLPLASLLLICYRKHDNHDQLPPGKMGWPVVGDSLEYLSTGWKGHPEKFFFDRLSKYTPNKVFKTSILGEKMVVMCEASSNKFLFSNENKLVQSWWPSSVSRILLSSNKSSVSIEGKKMRKLKVINFLKPKALQGYIPIMDTFARQHFAAEWEGKDEVVVHPLAKRYTFFLAWRLIVSIEDESYVAMWATLFNDVIAGVVSIPINFPGTPFHRGMKASKLMKKELKGIIKQRKQDLLTMADPVQDDVLSNMLLTLNEDGEYLSETDIANWIMGLIIGGHDTSSATTTLIVKYLAELPHIYDAVYKEQMEIAESKTAGELLNWEDIQKMKYSRNVACEVLRLAPPSQGIFREAIADFMYGGFQIPKGWKIYSSVSATHRNPEYFPEPERSDPSRFEGDGLTPYTFVPFGGGPRICPGMDYAILNILVFMHNLVTRFKWHKLIPDEQIVFNPSPMPTEGLPVRLFPHESQNAAA